jgi:hypothetical protein
VAQLVEPVLHAERTARRNQTLRWVLLDATPVPGARRSEHHESTRRRAGRIGISGALAGVVQRHEQLRIGRIAKDLRAQPIERIIARGLFQRAKINLHVDVRASLAQLFLELGDAGT